MQKKGFGIIILEYSRIVYYSELPIPSYRDSENKHGWEKIDNLPASMLLAPAKLENSVNNDNDDDDETEDDGFKPAKKNEENLFYLKKKKWRKSNMKNDLP